MKKNEIKHRAESDAEEKRIVKYVQKHKREYMCEFINCVDYPQYVIVNFTIKNHRDINYYCDKHYIRNVAKAFRDGYDAVKVYKIDELSG